MGGNSPFFNNRIALIGYNVEDEKFSEVQTDFSNRYRPGLSWLTQAETGFCFGLIVLV